jgi:hypothetical protein
MAIKHPICGTFASRSQGIPSSSLEDVKITKNISVTALVLG